MKPILDSVLFLLWVAVYLTTVSWIARSRKAKVHALGPDRHTDYRSDQDIVLRVAIFILGAVMLVVGYLATRVIGQHV